MALHLIKLSVGPEKLADLESWQERRLRELKRSGQPAELVHITRHTPKRAEEILAGGGSIYWVIKGWIVARQQLREFRPLLRDGVAHCGLVYAPAMVRVEPRPHRPFQGWRYFQPENAPRDLAPGEEGIPDELRRQLIASGLI